MALIFLRVLVLGVIAAAIDDGVVWLTPARRWLQCSVPQPERALPRRPPPLLGDDDVPRPRPYLWYRGDEEINSKRIFPNGTLDLARRHDGDSYHCGVKKSVGIVRGYPIDLKLAHMEKQFLVHPENQTARVGQPVSISCGITSAPEANVTWTRDDAPLPEDPRYHVLSQQLLILDTRRGDAGDYRCTATNSYVSKTKTSHVGRLEVEDRSGYLEPGILALQENTNITAREGSMVTLYCPVFGSPKPKLVWYFTPPSRRVEELESEEEVLVLTSLQLDLEGVYRCNIKDDGSLGSKEYRVTPTIPVSITLPPSPKDALRASTVRFPCSATGHPEPTITWYKDGKKLPLLPSTGGRVKLMKSTQDDGRLELVISGVLSSDAGIYQCFASNPGSVESAWTTLQVGGAHAAPPPMVRCNPVGAKTVHISWTKPSEHVVAYTVHLTSPDKAQTQPGEPKDKTEGDVQVEKALTPYHFQVRAYVNTLPYKGAASDLSHGVTCQGQGVPIKLFKQDGSDQVVVSWSDFAAENNDVIEWILQYKPQNTESITNVTLDGAVQNYTLNAKNLMDIRLLGTKTLPWLAQNLTVVPWTSSDAAGNEDDWELRCQLTSQDIDLLRVTATSVTAAWRCEEADDRYQYLTCISHDDFNVCQESNKTTTTISNLVPNTEYELRLHVRIRGRAKATAMSEPVHFRTSIDGPRRFDNLTHKFVNSSTLQITWSGPVAQYTVHHSAKLTLPVEQWASIQVFGKSVLIPNIKPTDQTFVMVTGYDPVDHSSVMTIQPQVKDLDLKDLNYSYTRGGVRVWWSAGGARTVNYAQNIAAPVETWKELNVTENFVELRDLNASLPVHVLVTATGSNRNGRVATLTIPPRPVEASSYYLGVGIGVGVLLLLIAAGVAFCLWRRRKPRPRRRPDTQTLDDAAEMKNIGGRLANGGGSKDAGEPLLNGHVHITENPTSKTPNGKVKKGHRYEVAFDVSRFDPDATAETVLEADTSTSTSYNLLDASRRPDLDLSRSRDNSFTKLPDDNMNCELNRSTFMVDNSKIQPTLQPNG